MSKKSIITEYETLCLICNKPAQCTHHVICGTSDRRLADEDGLTIPLCNSCHNMSNNSMHLNQSMNVLGHIIGQLAFEKEMVSQGMSKEESRKAFIKRYKKSRL